MAEGERSYVNELMVMIIQYKSNKKTHTCIEKQSKRSVAVSGYTDMDVGSFKGTVHLKYCVKNAYILQ